MNSNAKDFSFARPVWRCVILISLLLVLTSPTWGQTSRGSLQVSVTDANGAAVPGAIVTITKQGTTQSKTLTTADDGTAVFRDLEPGIYDVAVEKTNFAKLIRKDVQVAVGRAEIVSLPLQLPASVNIAEQERLREQQQEQISPLPNPANDLTPLLQIVPGSIATGPSSLGRVVIDGKGNEQQTVRLDGVDFSLLTELPGADATIDALSSFQKPEVAGDLDNSAPQTRAFAPIFGPGTGSALEAVTYKALRETDPLKSSIWRAQGYGEHRNEAFNARNFFDYDGKNGIRRSRFGAKAGGPLDNLDHFFLFLAYDGIRGRTERNVYEAIPSDASCGCAVGPLAHLMGSYLPAGTQLVPGASLNPDFVVARRRILTRAESNAWDFRIDYYPHSGLKEAQGGDSPKSGDVFTFRLTPQVAETLVPEGVTGRSQRQRFRFINGLVGLRLVRSTKPAPNSVTKEFGHNLRFGFNETRARVDVVSGPTTNPELSGSLITLGGTVKTIGLPGAPLTVPVATIGGLIKGPSRGLELEPSSYSLVYEYSRQVGVRNELFAGVEGRFLRFKFDRLGGLTYAFPNISSARTGTPSSVTFLSDLSQPGPFTSGSGPRHARQEYFMGYTQMVSEFRKAGDPGDPRNEPALKVTFGLRYDYFGAVRERDNRAILVDPESHAILPGGTAFYRTSKLNLQPRIGLAYRLAESSFFRNTVLRAGVGIYSGVGRMGDSVLPIESERFSTGINGGSFPLTSAEVVRSFVENPDTRQFQPLAFARDFVGVERAYKWDAQLTHTLYGYDLSVLYAGNVGRNLPLANLANKIVSVTTNPDPTKAAIVVREFDIVRGGQLFKPFGEFFFRTSEGHSSYNGLTIQFKRNRRADSSLEPWLKQAVMNLNVQYTLSRNVGNVSGTIVSNPFQRNADFGYNAADARHNFKVSAVYDLWSALRRTPTNPFWGWKIMPSLKVSSGLPLIVRLNRPDIVYVDNAGNVFATPAVGRTAVINTPGGGESGGARTPDLIPGVNPYLRNGLEVLNPAAFAIPAPGQFGNLRRGQLRGPAIVQLDLGLRRNIFNSEKSKLSGEFQIDLYNVFNRANFINPTAALPGLLGTSTSDNQLQPGRPFTKASAGSFGILSAADVGRVIQFSFTVRLNQGFTK